MLFRMIRLDVTSVEGIDETLGEIAFTVQVFDECSATVELVRRVHCVESWAETAEAIGKALAQLNLK
jgi:hypothetical protein